MKQKTDFEPFKVGTIFNPVKNKPSKVSLQKNFVKISYPSRLNLMAIDPSKITSNQNLVYTPGEYILKVKIYKNVSVRADKSFKGVVISPFSKRKVLILHSALLMKKALRFKEGLFIDVDNKNEFRHVGLGSSSALIASVACAINELYGNPINAKDLVQYLAQNHGEEIEGSSEYINPVQCIGGSAAGGLYEGALMILAGKSRIISTMKIPDGYKVIIGIPQDYVELDSKILFKKEQAVFHKFMHCGVKYGPEIAYRTLHSVLPAMIEGDIETIGDLVFDYRFNMGSIDNCSYAYPKLVQLASRLAFLKTKRFVDILSISSVGPSFFAVSKNINKCKKIFKKENLNIIITEPENNKYQIV